MECVYFANEKGAMTNELSTMWLKRVILRMFPNRELAVVLIMDGYGSHICYNFLTECRKANVHVILRVPHTSHKTQGEDIVNYMVFKPAFAREKHLVLREKITKQGRITSLDKTDLVRCTKGPWEKAFSYSNNMSGWAKEGIIPFTRAPMHEAIAAEKAVELARKNSNGNCLEHAKAKLADVFVGCAEAEEYQAMTQEELLKELLETKAKLDAVTKKKNTRLTSARLFGIKGGVSADEAYELVKKQDENRSAANDAKQKRKIVRDEQLHKKRAKRARDLNDVVLRLQKGEKVASLTKEQLIALLEHAGEGVSTCKSKAYYVDKVLEIQRIRPEYQNQLDC